MQILDLDMLTYRDAWALQEKIHAEVLGGAEEHLILVEHPPVITFGRRAEIEGQKNLIASADYLSKLGVEIVQSDRGGDVTFHGPGQIVAYPIVRLNDHKLSVGAYVHRLEKVVIDALEQFGIASQTDPAAIGVWTKNTRDEPEKICAIGVRIRRGVSLHGIALNVETDLKYFDLIVPCGLEGNRVTSMREILGDKTPSIESMKKNLVGQFVEAFAPSSGG